MARKWTRRDADKAYWSRLWSVSPAVIGSQSIKFCIITRREEVGYWVSLRGEMGGEDDIGPFDTFEAAAACFETIVGE
jgi:hypothetical protein